MKIKGIQILRGWAILIVIYTHLSISTDVLSFLGLSSDHNTGWIGVELFFIISGLVVSRSLRNSNYNLRRFYWHRVFRLLPTLFVMLFLALITECLITLKWPASSFSVGSWTEYFKDNFFVITGLYNWLGSGKYLVFGAMWSLSVEEQFYFLVAFIALLASKLLSSSILVFRAIRIFGAAFILFQLISMQIGWTPIFLLSSKFEFIFAGVLLDGIIKNPDYTGANRVKGVIVWFILLGTLLTAGFFGGPMTSDPDIKLRLAQYLMPILLVVYSLVIYLASTGADLSLGIGKFGSLLEWLGERSYVLYVTHFLVFAWAWVLIHKLSFLQTYYGVSQALLVMLIALPFADMLYNRLEQPFIKYARQTRN